MELLEDADEVDEVDQLVTWWNRFDRALSDLSVLTLQNRQIFPLYTTTERLPTKNSALARIRQKRADYQAGASIDMED